MSGSDIHVLWKSEGFRCVLIAHRARCFVQVELDGIAIYAEPCKDPEEAAKIAEDLWDQFIEPAT